MTRIATHLRPSRVIFTVNVDGIYKDMKNKKPVKVNSPINDISFMDSSIDVTGGMGRKISEAFEIARLGIDVNIVNGLDADRVFDILRGIELGTIIPAIPYEGRR